MTKWLPAPDWACPDCGGSVKIREDWMADRKVRTFYCQNNECSSLGALSDLVKKHRVFKSEAERRRYEHYKNHEKE